MVGLVGQVPTPAFFHPLVDLSITSTCNGAAPVGEFKGLISHQLSKLTSPPTTVTKFKFSLSCRGLYLWQFEKDTRAYDLMEMVILDRAERLKMCEWLFGLRLDTCGVGFCLNWVEL